MEPRSIVALARREYPLSPAGTLLVIVSARLLYLGFAGSSAYAFIVGATALLFVGILTGLGLAQSGGAGGVELDLDTARPPRARVRGASLVYRLRRSGGGDLPGPWPLYRYIVSARGRLDPGLGPGYRVRAWTVDSGEGLLPVLFPAAGSMRTATEVRLSDVFGLTRFHLASAAPVDLSVHPGLGEAPAPDVQSLSGGEEEKSRKSAEDIERYYMREYQPGDRLRDINWKAASRSPVLVTRIPPDAREQTKTIRVEVRHFRSPSRKPDRFALAHLDFCKAWVSLFLRRVLAELPGCRLRVGTGEGTFLVTSGDELQSFENVLCRFGLSEEPFGSSPVVLLPGQQVPEELLDAAKTADTAGRDVYIFTTPYDPGLAAAVARHEGGAVTVYTTISRVSETALRFALVQSFDALPLPGPWLFAGDAPTDPPDQAAAVVERVALRPVFYDPPTPVEVSS